MNLCSQLGHWPRRQCLLPAVHKTLVFFDEKGSVLYLVLSVVVLTGVRGERQLAGWALQTTVLQRQLLPSFCQTALVGMLLGHPRFSSTDMGLETGQEMEMHCDFLCPLLLLEPNSKSSLGFRGRGVEIRLKERGGVGFFTPFLHSCSLAVTTLVTCHICFQVIQQILGIAPWGSVSFGVLLKCSHKVMWVVFFLQNVSPF